MAARAVPVVEEYARWHTACSSHPEEGIFMTRVLRWCTLAVITARLPAPLTFVYGWRTAPDHLAADLLAGILEATKGQHT